EESIPVHNQKFYDADGNLALTIDTGVDSIIDSNASRAGIKIEENASDKLGLFTQSGILSEGSFMKSNKITRTHGGSVLGVLTSRLFSFFGRQAGVIGYNDAPTDQNSYGGWFNT